MFYVIGSHGITWLPIVKKAGKSGILKDKQKESQELNRRCYLATYGIHSIDI